MHPTLLLGVLTIFPAPPIPKSLVCISQGSLENRINRRENWKRKERGRGDWEKEGEKERNLRKFGRADVMVQKSLAMKIPMTVKSLTVICFVQVFNWLDDVNLYCRNQFTIYPKNHHPRNIQNNV